MLGPTSADLSTGGSTGSKGEDTRVGCWGELAKSAEGPDERRLGLKGSYRAAENGGGETTLAACTAKGSNEEKEEEEEEEGRAGTKLLLLDEEEAPKGSYI
jgi:hypothetical protein